MAKTTASSWKTHVFWQRVAARMAKSGCDEAAACRLVAARHPGEYREFRALRYPPRPGGSNARRVSDLRVVG